MRLLFLPSSFSSGKGVVGLASLAPSPRLVGGQIKGRPSIGAKKLHAPKNCLLALLFGFLVEESFDWGFDSKSSSSIRTKR